MRTDPTNFVFSSTGCRSGGKLTTTIGTNATGWRDIIQPDGKIVVIGAASTGGIVARYNADGSLDTSFGTSGIFTSSSPWFIDGAIQSDGKIVAVGVDSGNFNIVRLNSDGTIDTSFGSGGSKEIDFGGSDFVMGVALAPDGKIVVAGPTITGGSGDFAIARLTTSGALDTSFNSTGKETLDLGDNDGPSGVLVQPSGKIVVVGQSGGGAYVVRFNASGGVDNSFGPSGNGKVYLYGDYAFRMNVQALSDDRLLVSGNEGGYLVLHRYSIDGIADTSFGTSGVVQTNLGGGADWAYDIGVQPDGKVITVGADYNGGADCAVVRYNVDGSVDTTFGSSGTMLIWYGSSSYSETDYFESVAIQPDGQIVAVGTANGKFALARMNGGLTRLYAQQDGVYNVTALVDVSGAVKQRLIYTPDGVMTVLSPTWGSTTDRYAWRYTFQGGRYDAATGMIRFGLRDYRAALGTWVEQDPTGAMYVDGTDLYQFADSNPIALTDPLGLDGSVPYTPPVTSAPPATGGTTWSGPTDYENIGAGGLVVVQWADQWLVENWPAYRRSANWARHKEDELGDKVFGPLDRQINALTQETVIYPTPLSSRSQAYKDLLAQGIQPTPELLDIATGGGHRVPPPKKKTDSDCDCGPYGDLADGPGIGAGKDFTPAQKAKIIAANMARNGGVVRSDLSGKVLSPPSKSMKGVTPSPDEWQIDHVRSKDKGGGNDFCNAQVLSREENRAKSNK